MSEKSVRQILIDEGYAPDVVDMVLALPGLDMGDRTHDYYVNRLMGGLPGRFSKFIGEGPLFRGIFFPNWGASGLYDRVSAATGKDDRWWSDFAVAVLCQSMLELAYDLRKQLKRGDIDGAVGRFNGELRAVSYRFYPAVLLRDFPAFRDPAGRIDHATARGQYRKALIQSVPLHALWYESGIWPSPEWEMFHHYEKLLALGASEAEVDQLITDLEAAGLPIPGVVRRDQWRSYTAYLLNRPDVNRGDTDGPAQKAIQETTYLPHPGGVSRMPEGNSYEFTANSQPGSKYRSTGGSCLSGGTRVRMADGTARPVREVRVGDRVSTPAGDREVLMMAVSPRGDRPLYAPNGLTVGFTDTHPLVAAEGSGPEYLAADPDRLAAALPTLAYGGIGRLAPGAAAAGLVGGRPEAVPVTRVDLADDPDPLTYDVLTEPEPGGQVLPYYAGDGRTFLTVAPEFPILARGPLATTVLLGVLEECLPEVVRRFSGADEAENLQRAKKVAAFLAAHGPARAIEVVAGAAAHAQSRPTTQPPATADVATRVRELLVLMGKAPPAARMVSGLVFEWVGAALGEWVEGTCRLGGWNPPPGSDHLGLAVFAIRWHTPHGLAAGRPVSVTFEHLGSGATPTRAEVWTAGGRPSLPCAVFVDRVAVLPLGQGEPPHIACVVRLGGHPSAAGRLSFAEFPPRAPRFVSVPLRDPAARSVGELSLEVRGMSAVANASVTRGWTLDTTSFGDGLARALRADLALWPGCGKS